MATYRHYDDDSFDENGLLRDGRRVRVPMMMADGGDDALTNVQRSVRDATAPLRVVDGLGNSGLALHRPGPRYLTAGARTTDHATLVRREAERRQAYDDSVTNLQDAWKHTGISDREVQRIHDTGIPVADAYLDQKYDLENSWRRRR